MIVSPSLTDEGLGETVITGAAGDTIDASTSSFDFCQTQHKMVFDTFHISTHL